MIVTHTRVEKHIQEDNEMGKQEVKNKIIEINNQPDVCDENCIFSFFDDNENSSEELKIIKCSFLHKDVEYKKCCIECPMIDKATYESQIIDAYNHKQAIEGNSIGSIDAQPINIEDEKINSAMEALKDVQSVVIKMLDDKVINREQADALVWGALLECHNINTDLVPQNTIYQIYGIWASRQFRK